MPEKDLGKEMYDFMHELYPICRSITGNGVRQTLKIIKSHIPIEISEVSSGTKVFDWTIPKEWDVSSAYIKNSKGEKIVDFKNSNLHLLNYSIPVKKKVSLAELRTHLHSLPDQPDVIPYLTSYYKEDWGFCITHRKYLELKEDTYEVFIDSKLSSGSMTYGELYIKGKTAEEVLFSCYVCHPSLCNDNLSGVVLLVFLAKSLLKKKNLKYSYRFIFIPETIGAIAWLSINEKNVGKIKHGLVATCVGDPGCSTYKKTRQANAIIDQAVVKVLIDSGKPYKILDFFPSGSDERQFCSPGFNLPIGSLMRTPYGNFPEYHTSADDLNFVKPDALMDSLSKYLQTVYILENNLKYVNRNPKCEPQLGKRGLYNLIGGSKRSKISQTAMLWVLNFSDGSNSLLDISVRSNIDFPSIKDAADDLYKSGLLKVSSSN